MPPPHKDLIADDHTHTRYFILPYPSCNSNNTDVSGRDKLEIFCFISSCPSCWRIVLSIFILFCPIGDLEVINGVFISSGRGRRDVTELRQNRG